mgnify:CR=1 FL=1
MRKHNINKIDKKKTKMSTIELVDKIQNDKSLVAFDRLEYTYLLLLKMQNKK